MTAIAKMNMDFCIDRNKERGYEKIESFYSYSEAQEKEITTLARVFRRIETGKVTDREYHIYKAGYKKYYQITIPHKATFEQKYKLLVQFIGSMKLSKQEITIMTEELEKEYDETECEYF